MKIPHLISTPAVLFRERVCDDAGQPLADIPENWELQDSRESDLLELGRGQLAIFSVNDSDFFFKEVITTVDPTSDIYRAAFTPDSPCPEPRMTDILAVALDDGVVITYEVILTHGDMPHHLKRPGEMCMVLRAELSLI